MIPRVYLNRSTSAPEVLAYSRRLPTGAPVSAITHRYDDRVPRGMVILVIDGGLITDDEPDGTVDT